MADLAPRVQAALGHRFRIERELGRGGMATVFLAEDLKHSRLLALKILHPDLAAALGPERFRREIDFAAHLNHPHILTLVDSGEDDGLLWYAMPYVEGESLRHRLMRERVLPVHEVVGLARQVATALDYAHGQGLLHRDIKPENILLAHGHAWVADFGIAKALRPDPEANVSITLVIGTPAYMSPEQAAGDALDSRSDLYSLGAVICECLSGTAPLGGTTPVSARSRRSRASLSPLRSGHGVTPGVQAALRRALAFDPAERQATPGAFAAELEATVTSPDVRRATWTATLRTLAMAAGVIVLGTALLRILNPPPLFDEHRVMLLPPEMQSGLDGAAGTDLAISLEAILNTTGVLLPWLGKPDGYVGGTPADEPQVRELAEARRTPMAVITSLAETDSLRISITLHDFANQGRRVNLVALPRGTTPWVAAVEVAGALLPDLLPTGGRIDRGAIANRKVEAIASFLLGERAYRSGRFADADSLLSLAVRQDSTFALAALRGAQAASWQVEPRRALELIGKALTRIDSLGPRFAAFARGLEDYQLGRADSAISRFRAALAIDPQWAEAHMALGEVYQHLLPLEGRPFDRAGEAFRAARTNDPTFTPPLFHLFQHAVWSQEYGAADSLFRLLEKSRPRASLLDRARLTSVACQSGRPDVRAWRRIAKGRDSLRLAAETAIDLATGGLQQAACAEAGLRAVIATDTAGTSPYWVYANTALAFLLSAEGRYDEARPLIADTVIGAGFSETISVLLAIAGSPFEAEATAAAVRIEAEVAREMLAVPTARLVRQLWTLATWRIHRGAVAGVEDLQARLVRAAVDTVGSAAVRRSSRLFAESIAARLMLARGDTAGALRRLRALAPTAEQAGLRWQPWEVLAHERFLVIQLLEGEDRLREAFDLAEGFDSPASFGFLLYLRRSLDLRQSQANRLGYVNYARELRSRAAALAGRGENPSPGGKDGATTP
jgi:serine/threonine-protein kinase